MYNKDIACFSQDGLVNAVHCAVNTVSEPLWAWLLWLLLGVGVFFSVTTGLVQFRLFGRSLKEISGSRQDPNDPHGITSFQAFVTGLASRVGTGNIAGVAIAISMGGAGAVFWMWLVALIGMASAFAESSLAQLYKVRDKKTGLFRGGPAYYIAHGLNLHWLSVLFSVSLIVCFGFVYQSIQANTIVQAVQSAANMTAADGVSAETWHVYKHGIGALLVLLKWLEVDPVSNWSWWWILAPLGVAFLWFEFFERMFGRDKRQLEMAAYEKRARERVAQTFDQQARRS